MGREEEGRLEGVGTRRRTASVTSLPSCCGGWTVHCSQHSEAPGHGVGVGLELLGPGAWTIVPYPILPVAASTLLSLRAEAEETRPPPGVTEL